MAGGLQRNREHSIGHQHSVLNVEVVERLLNSPIRSVVDLKAVADLAKVDGDLGRVGGLLKLWLAEKRGQGASPVEVEGMMIEFRELQSCIRGK